MKASIYSITKNTFAFSFSELLMHQVERRIPAIRYLSERYRSVELLSPKEKNTKVLSKGRLSQLFCIFFCNPSDFAARYLSAVLL